MTKLICRIHGCKARVIKEGGDTIYKCTQRHDIKDEDLKKVEEDDD